MIKSLTILLVVIINFFLIPKKVFSSLKINEIYPAPLSGEEEWVELFNSLDYAIDLSYYLLVDATNKKIVFSTSSALPSSYILATSSGVINNTGPETIFLKNVNNEVLDIASYSSSVTFDANKSFIRCPDSVGEWYLTSFVTKNQSNQEACIILTPTLTPTPTQILSPTSSPTIVLTQTLTPTPTPISYEKIYLSEVMVDPSNEEKEWVEIYNDNDFLVKLDNWYIDDLENGGSTPKSFDMVLDKKSYRVIEFSSAIFNNSGDQVRLLDFNKSEKDSFEYSFSTPGKTYGRVSFSSDEWCLQEPTIRQENSSCLVTPTSSNLSTTTSNSQSIKLSPSPSIKSSSFAKFISSSQQKSRYSNKKIFKSYQPKLVSFETEINSPNGEIFGEETKKSNKKNDLLFLPLFYSLSAKFFFLRKILKQIPWKS